MDCSRFSDKCIWNGKGLCTLGASCWKANYERLNIEPLQHPQYSQDLAICDFFLFSTAKDHLRGRKFESIEELGTAIFEALRTVARDGLQHVLHT